MNRQIHILRNCYKSILNNLNYKDKIMSNLFLYRFHLIILQFYFLIFLEKSKR